MTTYPAEELAACDFAIVCVGTPESDDGHAELAYVEQAAADLPHGLPVVLRSTVPPGTTDRLFGGSERLYCHAPEFMGENVLHSWQRSSDVPYMILGGDPEATHFFHERFAQVFPGTIHECSAKESELAKYAANLYWATRVTFVNEFALVCKQFGVELRERQGGVAVDPRMTSVYTKRAGYPPGFDGRCWPKDLAALIAASSDAGITRRSLAASRAPTNASAHDAGTS
jgi:UDPglucose 6-dehydrogenase